MTISTSKEETPVYDAKIIYEFGEKNEVGIKKFLEINPNL